MSIYLNAIYTDDNIASSDPVAVNNVGYNLLNTFKAVTYRPNGRNDYQLIFIKQGTGYFDFNNETVPINKNHIVLYKPNQPQKYVFYPEDSSESFWIHFSGTQIETILQELDLDRQQYFFSESVVAFTKAYNLMFSEIRHHENGWKIKCISSLMNLLVTIKRETKQEGNNMVYESINLIKQSIEKNYYSDTSNKDYAKQCNMCLSNFLRLFKEITHTTPQQYKTTQRISAAQNLLANSNYSISQISKIVGFSDSLYFSRVFKKIIHLSPTEYRQNLLSDSH